MTSPILSPTPGKQAEAAIRQGGGAGAIEIVGFPQILHTRTIGDPDILFVRLLDAAREAEAMVERLSAHGEKRPTAAMLSGMHLASSLLRDANFALVVKGQPHECLYTVDLEAGTLHLRTRLYAVVSRRASFFRVEIAGKVSEGAFVVRNPSDSSVILQVGEDRLREPNAFSWLAQECLRAQIEQERIARLDETQTTGELQLIVPVSGGTVRATLRPKEDGAGGWDIIDGRQRECVGALPTEIEIPLKKVLKFLGDLLAEK